jgi:hypothetical protein
VVSADEQYKPVYPPRPKEKSFLFPLRHVISDFVVDPTNRRLIGKPEHNGEHMMDMF